MSKLIKPEERLLAKEQKKLILGNPGRRTFLQKSLWSLAGMAVLGTACSKDEEREGVYLGTGDVGILNYLYGFEQMEAGFYAQATQTFYSGATDLERSLLTDIRDHAIAHREFFKNALGEVGIPALDLNFSMVSFGNRESILGTARTLKDLGVSAYNGAGPLLLEADYVMLIGKIVSVKARHAALLRNLISYGSFANSEVIDANGLDKSLSPAEVIALTATYIKSPINADDLPTV